MKCNIVVHQNTLNPNQSLNGPIQRNVKVLPNIYKLFENHKTVFIESTRYSTREACKFQHILFSKRSIPMQELLDYKVDLKGTHKGYIAVYTHRSYQL